MSPIISRKPRSILYILKKISIDLLNAKAFYLSAIVYPGRRGSGRVQRAALIDAQKIRLTHSASMARIPTRNITLTNDFRRCVKRSHCSAAEVRRWAGNTPLGRSHFRCREWQSVFVNTNYHARRERAPAFLLYWIIGKLARKWIWEISSTRLIRGRASALRLRPGIQFWIRWRLRFATRSLTSLCRRDDNVPWTETLRSVMFD